MGGRRLANSLRTVPALAQDGLRLSSAAAFIPLGPPRWSSCLYVSDVRAPRTRAIAIGMLASALLVPLAGCGSDDEGGGAVQEDELRDCLTQEGLTVEASDLGSSAALGNATPDFQVMSKQGEIADLLVEGSDEKANRRAADVQGAKQSFGAAQTEVVVKHNAVIIYESSPPGSFRSQVETCVE